MLEIIYACATDQGPVRPENQDAFLVKQAFFNRKEQALLAVLCDGVGGLSLGSLASSHTIRRLEQWFDHDFDPDTDPVLLGCSWERILQQIQYEFRKFTQKENQDLGTTLTALLIWKRQYLLTQIGDSRCYRIRKMPGDKKITDLLTLDQKVPDSGALWQWLGGDRFLKPVIRAGILGENEVFVLCSDGFWKKTPKTRIEELFSPGNFRMKEDIRGRIRQQMADLILKGETDNISAAVIWVRQS